MLLDSVKIKSIHQSGSRILHSCKAAFSAERSQWFKYIRTSYMTYTQREGHGVWNSAKQDRVITYVTKFGGICVYARSPLLLFTRRESNEKSV